MDFEVHQRFAGKVALLTGAASGIGRATTVRLAREGANVLALDVNDDGLAETASLASDAAGKVEVRRTDVSSRADCFAAVAAAVETFGRLDILGNIAGIARADHFTEISEEDYRRFFAVNVDGYFFLCQAAIPHLLETNGNIVNIASNAGLMGCAYTVAYSMTKGAVIQLTRGIAAEYAKTKLRVNAIAPGGVATTLQKTYQMPSDVDFELIKPYMGFRGNADAADIAALFAFVASDEAHNIHGAILPSDGGLTAY